MNNDKKILYGLVSAFVLVIIVFISLQTTQFSVLGGEDDVIYTTDANGNTYPVKITYNDFSCEEAVDCNSQFAELSSAAEVQENSDYIFCIEQKCVVDFR